MVAGSLTILRKAEENFLLIETKALLERRTNDKAIYQTIVDFNSFKCGTPSAPARKLHSID